MRSSREYDSQEPVEVHLRLKRADNLDGKTLCGKQILDPELKQYLKKKRKTIDHGDVPDDKKYLMEPNVFSMMASSAWAFETSNTFHRGCPQVSPHNPGMRWWIYCEGCWDHHYRTLKELANTEL